ncbi:MAG: hypothetical protein IJX74_07480 [Clostridia bacterium]|nr:hypothetical protein [Clostridia bacterium]
MNLFEINYLDKLSALLKEAFKFKKYKAMPPALAVFVGILMLPFVLASFAVAATFAFLAFAFAVFTSPVKFLHTLVNKEGKDVLHATQFIVYLISWPFIFLCYSIMAFLLLLIIPAYAALSILLYVWSFGGFKFHLFMTESDNISITVEKKYMAIPLVYVIVGFILVAIIPFVHWLIGYSIEAWNSWEAADIYTQLFPFTIYPSYIGIHALFSFVYSLVCSPFPKNSAKNEVDTTDSEAQ